MLALARANLRYWPRLAPHVNARLRRWQTRARRIEDGTRRDLALANLRDERFNPQLATTLATLAPSRDRRRVADAILATQLAYDYRDSLQERDLTLDDFYARELDAAAAAARSGLPSLSAVAATLATAADRHRAAQRRAHAALRQADYRALARWAQEQATAPLGWPEWLAGAQASVLAVHALTALAATPGATPVQAAALDRVYLSIGALTALDALVDRRDAHELPYSSFYDSPAQMGERLAVAARDARERAGALTDGAHHLITLAGLVAYYATAPGARDPAARAVLAPICLELGAAFGPVLAILRAWRLAKL